MIQIKVTYSVTCKYEDLQSRISAW